MTFIMDHFTMIEESFARGDWFLGTAGIVITILFLLIALVIIACILNVIDKTGRPQHKVQGTIIKKQFMPEHAVLVGTIPLYRPDQWSVQVTIPGGKTEVIINEDLYNVISPDDPIDLAVVTGRLSKSPRVIGVWG